MNKITLAALVLTFVQGATAQSYTLTPLGGVPDGIDSDPLRH